MEFLYVGCCCAVCTWSRNERGQIFFSYGFIFFGGGSIFNLDTTSPFCEVEVLVFVLRDAKF